MSETLRSARAETREQPNLADICDSLFSHAYWTQIVGNQTVKIMGDEQSGMLETIYIYTAEGDSSIELSRFGVNNRPIIIFELDGSEFRPEYMVEQNEGHELSEPEMLFIDISGRAIYGSNGEVVEKETLTALIAGLDEGIIRQDINTDKTSS